MNIRCTIQIISNASVAEEKFKSTLKVLIQKFILGHPKRTFREPSKQQSSRLVEQEKL